MKNFLFGIFLSVLLISSAVSASDMVLWYQQPASEWNEALAIGNGRLGAMVYGGTQNEIIQFNEETLWSGQPHDYAHDGAHEVLGKLRRLLWDGKQQEAVCFYAGGFFLCFIFCCHLYGRVYEE